MTRESVFASIDKAASIDCDDIDSPIDMGADLDTQRQQCDISRSKQRLQEVDILPVLYGGEDVKFNIRLNRARKAANLSFKELSKILGISYNMLKKYEDGTIMPSSEILIKLSKVLNVSVEYFFRNTTVELKDIKYYCTS